MVGFRFNTIGVSDGISMGTDGMSYSLQSRDLIADSIETVMSAQWYDANVSLPGCDKNMPGSVIAMARLNRPAIMVYGGTIKPGVSALDGSVLDIVSAFQSYGAFFGGGVRAVRVLCACCACCACCARFEASSRACSRPHDLIELATTPTPNTHTIPPLPATTNKKTKQAATRRA